SILLSASCMPGRRAAVGFAARSTASRIPNETLFPFRSLSQYHDACAGFFPLCTYKARRGNMKRLFLGIGMLGLVCLAAPSRGEENKVELKPVKYDELTKLIANQKGKVVVVDFWADN